MTVSPKPTNGTWLTMKEVGMRYGHSTGKMSSIVVRNGIQTRNNPRDGRSKLIRLEDIEAILCKPESR